MAKVFVIPEAKSALLPKASASSFSVFRAPGAASIKSSIFALTNPAVAICALRLTEVIVPRSVTVYVPASEKVTCVLEAVNTVNVSLISLAGLVV